MAEALGRSLEKGREQQMIKGITPATGASAVTHHQFVDDTILVGMATIEEARGMKERLEQYERASNQKINMEKTRVYFVNTLRRAQTQISRILGCRIQELPTSYLGMPLFTGRGKIALWDTLVEKIQRKLAGWKGACLSQAGKILLLKTCLQNLPVYWMSLFEIPERIASRIEGIQKQFLWSGPAEKRKIPLVKWEEVCKPKKEGGLALRRIKETNKALLGKVAWKLKTGENRPWKEIIEKKYMEGSREQGNPSAQGSAIWKAIRNNLEIVDQGSRWKLGDGVKIRFWRDKWIKEEALEIDQDARDVMGDLEERYGAQVRGYIEEGRWKKMESQSGGQEQKVGTINQWLQQVHIPMRPKADKQVWSKTRDGEYTVKTGYEMIRGKGPEDEISKKVWKNRATPKVVVFLWLSSKGKILTMDNLQKRGWQMPNRCPMCKQEEETIDHLLIHCSYASSIWGEVLTQFGVAWANPKGWRDFIAEWYSPFTSQRLGRLWEVTLAQVAWNIWKERNQRIFQGKEREARALWAFTKEAIKENMQVIPQKGRKETGGEDQVRKVWGLPEITEKENPRKDTKWEAPPPGWIKLNFDGAAKGNPGEAGGGGVIRNHNGEVLWAFSEYYGIQSNHSAEMLAMKSGIQGGEKLGNNRIIIEGDSLNMIKLLKGENTPDWRNESLIEDLRVVIQRWVEVRIQHVYREGNKVADILANRGVRNKKEEQWEEEGPEEIRRMVKDDQTR